MLCKRTKTRLRGGLHWLFGTLMAVLFAWLMPQGASARDLICDVASNYMVMLNGANTVKIQVPVYDEESYDTWVEDGYLKYDAYDTEGKHLGETTLFRWYKDEDNHDNDDSDLWCKMSTGAGGSIEVTQGNSGKHFTLSGSGERRELIYERTSDHTYTIYAVWTVPYNVRGKTLRFKWSVMRNGTSSRKRYEISIDPTTITIPEPEGVVQPQVTAATLSINEKGKLELPWFIGSTKVQKVVAKYKNPAGSDWVSQTLDAYQSGTLYLSATEPHDAFRIIVDYKDNQGYLIEGVESSVQDLAMIHAPINFRASPVGGRKASVQLQWDIEYPEHEDLTPFDVFEIQRSLTGQEADFTTIGVETFDLETQHYTYTDSTLVDAISEAHLKGGGTLEKLTYRIRRMATQNWGWEGNTTASTASCVMDDLHLLRLTTYSAEWDDKQAYTVKVSWEYANEYNAVWDNRAKMMLRVVSANRAGEPVDTMLYTLTASELEACYKIVTLQRPCVKYDIKMYIDRGTSPIHTWDEITPYFFPIHSAADWQTFRDMVSAAKGQSDVNARLYADISTDLSIGWNTTNLYRGTFDGNGHTVDFNINRSEDCLALFRYVGNATIRNLHVKGSVTASSKFAAGLIGNVQSNSTVYIENCRSSVTITSSVNGDATNGGLVALVNSDAKVTIRNCLFDGSFEGANCHSNGGFVGWTYSNGLIENSLFAPTHLGTKRDGCATYARNDSWLTLKNCHATQEYTNNFIVISNADDWKIFRDMVKTAGGNYDVDAVMKNWISTDQAIGFLDDVPYRGTFNGNGNELNFNVDNRANSYIAPFSRVKSCTIKNLRVVGTLKGGIHSAGLIGSVEDNSATVSLQRIDVLTDVFTSNNYAGGIIGHAHSATIEIEDCRSYGQVTATAGANVLYGGAFIGWADNPNKWEFHRVYENVTFAQVTHAGFCYYNPGTPWGFGGNSTTCTSYHNWNEVKDEYRNIKTTDAPTILNQEKPGTWDTSSYRPVMETNALPTADELIALLGDGWKKEGDKAVVSVHSYDENKSSYPTPTLPDFYHESIGKVDKTLRTETRQSSVVLTWTTDGNPIDYFQVLRRVKGTESWEVIASDVDQMSYEDKTVSPLLDYEYKVRGTNDCEGLSYSETEVKPGACKHSGKLEGYVRFNDGTSVPGITIEIVSGSVKATAITDEKGYFMAEDLSYQGKQIIDYVVTPVATSGIKLEVESYSVTFNDKTNYQQVHEFTITNGYRFSGYVMYDGTSIPVKGVRFRVNKNVIHNAAGAYVETDFEGKFSFNVLGGNNIIQAVMDGHDFANDGYFKSPEGYVFTDNVAQIYFYDTTKVKLTGRVVGGKDQGDLPLDNNLSRNNLGDNLTMVMTLEGDNTSWLVYDNLNPGLSVHTDTIKHSGGKHKTAITVQRKRMTVKPDSVTGEYVLMLPPVRWKVQQVYCEGYPTLFQDGQVSEVIDLTNCLKPDTLTHKGTFVDVDGNSIYQPTEICNARYSRIYHAPVEITYKQLGYDTFDYFGDKAYQAQTAGGDRMTVPLAYEGTGGVHYTFGHPVFSIEKRYPIQLSVVERYPWNNASNTENVDVVRIGGGKVTVHNGMKNGTNQEVVNLDSLGQGLFYLKADQTTRLLTGDDALHTVTMTLTQDGTTYEAEPLKGYILNMFPTSGAKDVLVNGQPLLIDILRDPPGGGSSATLEKGSTLKYNYTMEMTYRAELNLSWSKGTTLENYQGVVAAPEGTGSTYGIINEADTKSVLDFGYGINGEGTRDFSYTMNVEQDISTSDDSHMVGADADLYIGTVQNVIVTPMSTIRAIPDAMYQQMLGKLGGGQMAGVSDDYGTLVHIAEGQDAEGNKYHLVRDESLAYGPKVQSQFVHSQKHILTQMVPGLIQQCRALMFTGTADEAQTQANATGKPVYRSLRSEDDDNFGVVNAKDGKPYYYTSTMPEDTTMNYVIHLPVGTGNTTDEVAEKGQIIMAWLNMIAENEREKLNASDLVANYDIDGGTEVNYSEEFESEYSISNYMHMPGIIKGDYFDNCWTDKLLGIGGMVGIKIANVFIKKLWGNLSTSATANGAQSDNDNSLFTTKVAFAGKNFEFSILPSLEYDVKDVSTEDNAYSRKESFKLAMHPKSHLNIDVFRAQTDTATVKAASTFDVFTNYNFSNMRDYVEPYLGRDLDLTKVRYPRSFVYRTRGGATCNSWEDERRSMFYNEGSILDERTKKIANPQITVDRQSISGVPYGEPARFKVFLTNESEQPEAATGGLVVFSFYLDETSNPKGAKLLVDGMPMTGGGREVFLYPGEVTQKVLEVYAGEDFDYENLTIGINSPDDWQNTTQELSLDVHYLRQAGPVNIASPGDKWIMNTDAEYNGKRGWFLPVTIDGFDKHQHNFDHIEFQYKESQRGDDYWTNLCSFYADSTLMTQANGVCEMIPENGNIHTEFYGEGTVMEKAYDLRAVLYCRNGNSFLTTPSKVMSGVKDTRRPQLFGTPEPKDGILRLGDNIIFNFTEDIEYNYLNAITNFEVKGEVNNQNVSEAVSVQFTGNSSVESEAQRNFSGKDLTIDLMIRPDETGRDMPLFSHGTNGKKLQLWLTSDRLLKAIVDDQTFVSDTAIVKGGFTQVAVSISQADSTLTFYNGGKTIGLAKLTEPYNGTGKLIFGRTNETNRSKSQYYEGRMMEARVWYRAMTGGQVGTTYGSRRLTGYELGLVDYYPMNEGSGDYALDHTQGANATLMGASWAMPRGWSLSLDNDGVELTQNALNRTPEQDYTLMFWFKTDDADGTILSNGSGKADNDGAASQFRIGIDDGTLTFRSNGMTVEAGSGYNDEQWHHYAMTVNRARGVANIYMDQALKATFSPDSIGGISGGTPYIGGMTSFVKNIILTGGTVTGSITESPYTFTGNGTQIDIPQQAPEVKNTVDLSTLTADYEAQDGDALTDTLRANVKITIADGATVTLDGAIIDCSHSSSYKWAGITCPGDATIFLKGENTVNGFYENYPGIYIAESKTLTIRGDGSLKAFNSFAAGIGGIYGQNCGNIVIEGGTINASSMVHGAGIGSGHGAACGDIIIKGGNITAKGGAASPGIGSAAIGSCGNITIEGGTVNAEAYVYNSAGIGSGSSASCGNITITGGTINAVGSHDGPGIGSGENGSCGDITIIDDVISVTATKNQRANNSIGAGNGGTVGTVTIGGNFTETYETDFKSDYTGNIDELCMFQQALPLTLIKAYATKSPNGDEAGLLTYLSFDRQERQKDNDIETVAYPWSKKIYQDDMGNIRYELDPVTKQNTSTPVRDYVFVAAQDEVLRHVTNETAAPVVPYEELTNLKFSFAGKDNQVMVELDELASRINRRNIYVTLRDVEDKNGNAMASPQTACYYVTNSSLQWQKDRQTWLASYGMEDYIYFDIINNSATSHTYTIENCPRWLDMESYSGIISPLGTLTIRGVVNKGLNVGSYDEIIYLTDEDGVAEPLYLNLTVTTSEPEWAWSVDGDLLKHSMNIAGQVYLNGEIDIDTRDIVGVFDRENRCHGFAHVSYSALTGESGLYLTVYDSEPSGTELFFKLWQYSTGRELMLTVDGNNTMTFRDKAVLGTVIPVHFEGGSLYVQTFNLKEGWNWVSFNVASERLFDLNTLLDGLPWQEGDVLTDMNSDLTLVYKNEHWLSSEQISTVRLSPRKAYAIKVQQDIQFPVAGSIIRQLDARTIELKQGWNGIGYTPMLNLSVETALSDYYDKAQPGDVIKSHDEFAYFTVTGGVGRWRGSLEYMKPGEGYMLLRKAESATTFTYPFYEPGSTFLDEWAYSTVRSSVPARARATMSVSAIVEGVALEEGDRLLAYADGEIVGSEESFAEQSGKAERRVKSEEFAPTQPLFYLSIAGDMQQGIWFAIERDGEIIASTSEQMTFKANAVIGSPDEPTKISFVQTNRTDGKWYSVSGIQLPKRPTQSGVYIFNGKKVVIK